MARKVYKSKTDALTPKQREFAKILKKATLPTGSKKSGGKKKGNS
jgi:hypothetical protein